MPARRCASSICCSIPGKVEGCSLQAFEDATGLRLTDGDGTLREELPPITTFLNRLLALTIDLQNTLFDVFEELLRAKIEGAIASGTYDVGVETIIAESLVVTDRRTLYVHPQSGAETSVFTIARRDRNRPLTLAEALERADDPRARLLVNGQSGRAAVEVPAPSLMHDDGTVERRVRLLRPMERPAIPLSDLAQTHWQEADRTELRPRLGGRDRRGAGVHRQRAPHRHGPVAADLEAAARTSPCASTGSRPTMASASSAGWSRRPGSHRPSTARRRRSAQPTHSLPCSTDGTVLQLQDGLELRRVKVMGEFRIELCGFTDGMVERLKAMGLISEIISWKLRLFVPTGASGPSILAKVMERHPLVRIADKAAA